MSSFMRGTLLLMVVAFAGECIEFLVNLVLAKQLGGVGMGMYMSILPVVALIMVLASLELPISISKFIAEKEQRFHASMLQHALWFTILFTLCLIAVSMIVLPFIPVFNHYHPFIRGLIIILIPLISLTSIARGYFMGVQQMSKIAIANFLRKVVQLVVLSFIYQLFSFHLDKAILVAFGTVVVSDFIVFVYMFYAFFLQLKQIKKQTHSRLSPKTVRKSLLSVSLPTTGMRIFHSVAHTIQPFLIKAALIQAGLSKTMATEQFGLLTGVALSIGFFPAFIAHSLSTALIPNVSEAYAQNDKNRLHRLLQQVIIVTMIYSIPVAFVFNQYSEELTKLFFHSDVAASYLQLLIPYFLFNYFVAPLQSFLIGLGMVKDTIYQYLWMSLVTGFMMYFLGSKPSFQMNGIIISLNTGAVLMMFLHYFTICKKIGISLILKKPHQSY